MKKLTTSFKISNDAPTQRHGIDIAKTIHPTIYTDQIGLSPSQIAQSQAHVCSFARAAQQENNMNNKSSHSSSLDYGITRRKFIGAAAGGSAALLTGGLTSLLKSTALAAGFIEATIPELQALMNSGALTSVQLTTDYLN